MVLVALAAWPVGATVTERVSVDSAGAQADWDSGYPSLSADGRFVAFGSLADNPVLHDTNGSSDVFVHDRQTGATERVSVDSAGGQSDSDTYGPAGISADGRYVLFSSVANNLVPNDTNGATDVFVHDRETGVTERVSVDSSGGQADGNSYSAALSADGRYVVFVSSAANLVAGDANDFCSDPPAVNRRTCVGIFLRDRQTGATERVSVNSLGLPADGDSDSPTISTDGRFVAFTSKADNLGVDGTSTSNACYGYAVYPDIAHHCADVVVHDRETGVTEIVSVSPAGIGANGDSSGPSLSADGRVVAFESYADNLVQNSNPNAFALETP